MRFFVALEIPPENLEELIVMQRKVKEILPDIQLTESDKMHLTIAFIGDQNESLKTPLIKLITDASRGVSNFEVSPGIIDGFPNIHHPNVIWVGVNGEIDNLLVLRERVKDGLAQLRLVVDERRFTPHITLAKTRTIQLTEDQEQKLQQLALEKFKSIRVSSIKLFESIPNHGFHSHNTLAEANLS